MAHRSITVRASTWLRLWQRRIEYKLTYRLAGPEQRQQRAENLAEAIIRAHHQDRKNT